jgi:zinc protease
VQDAFDAIGGTSGTDVGVEQATVWLSCLSAHASEGLALLHGALTQPRFDADIVERERARALAVRSQSLYQPSYLAQESFVPALLGEHPYAAGLLLPDPEFLARVDRAQAVAAVKAIVQPQLATLVVVGPRDDTLADAVRATFRSLPHGERERPPPPQAPVAPTQRDVRKIARPEMGQIYLRFGAVGFAASAPQRAAVLVCQRLLASGFSSVLLDELRVNRGLVYGIGLSQAWLRAPSPYSFITSTKAEQTEEVLNVTFAKLREVQAGTFTDEQLTAARNTLLADTAAGLETQLGVAYEVHEGLRDAGDPDAWRKELAAIAAVTRDDVRAIAGHYDPSRMTIVMVGTAEALARIDTSRIR